jgi:cation:H+ antiporter
MAILAVLALMSFGPGRSSISGGVLQDTQQQDSPVLFSAGLAILLTILGVVFTLVHTNITIFTLRPESLTLLVIWIVGTRALFLFQQSQTTRQAAVTLDPDKVSRQKNVVVPVVSFAAGCGIIFLASPTFANSAGQFAARTGLGDSFVGTWMLGFSTALPEFVTSMTACRLGAFDLAIANLYGSCAFNMVVFFAMDLASPRPIFSLLDPVLSVSGLLAVALMLLGLWAVAYRRHHILAPNLTGGAMLASYGCAVWILYAFR